MQNTPLYRQVYERLKYGIISGEYARGQALPSEKRLAEEFAVSQITIRRAIHELTLDGLVERRQGIGTIVRDNPRSVLIGLVSFTSDVAAGRLRLVRTLLTNEMIPAADDVAAKLALQPGTIVRHLSRLDSEGDVPISVDDVYTPAVFAACISPDMAASPLFMHLWQAASGITVHNIDYELAAEEPSKHIQALLHIGPDVPILFVGEVERDNLGRPLHYIISRYRSDRVRLSSSTQMIQVGANGEPPSS